MIQVLVGFHERLLQNVFRILAVLRHVLGQPENLAFVLLHQLPEGPGIAFAGPRNQRGFVETGLTGGQS